MMAMRRAGRPVTVTHKQNILMVWRADDLDPHTSICRLSPKCGLSSGTTESIMIIIQKSSYNIK